MASRRVGRPHTEGITEALMAAAEEVMARDGYGALTVDGLVAAVGTTRPTFYRRFPGVAHLALAVLTQRFGTGRAVDTGSLGGDLLVLQREEVAMFCDPVLRRSLVGLLGAVAADEQLRSAYLAHFIAPRRENVAAVVRAAVQRGEVLGEPSAEDLDFVCEVLLGPVLARALLPVGAPVDDHLARRSAEAASMVLRAVPNEGDSSPTP